MRRSRGASLCCMTWTAPSASNTCFCWRGNSTIVVVLFWSQTQGPKRLPGYPIKSSRNSAEQQASGHDLSCFLMCPTRINLPGFGCWDVSPKWPILMALLYDKPWDLWVMGISYFQTNRLLVTHG